MRQNGQSVGIYSLPATSAFTNS